MPRNPIRTGGWLRCKDSFLKNRELRTGDPAPQFLSGYDDLKGTGRRTERQFYQRVCRALRDIDCGKRSFRVRAETRTRPRSGRRVSCFVCVGKGVFYRAGGVRAAYRAFRSELPCDRQSERVPSLFEDDGVAARPEADRTDRQSASTGCRSDVRPADRPVGASGRKSVGDGDTRQPVGRIAVGRRAALRYDLLANARRRSGAAEPGGENLPPHPCATEDYATVIVVYSRYLYL